MLFSNLHHTEKFEINIIYLTGRGMNAAFAIGRPCDITKGRTMLPTLPEANKMVTHLGMYDGKITLNSYLFAINLTALY